MKKVAIGIMAASLLIGCADERKQTTVLRETVLEKSAIPENVDYLYVPSDLDSPRSSTATRPHWMGEGKRVRFKFAENKLMVLEVEKDQRFVDNPTNFKPVMEIPITNKDYKCSQDAYGDCTPNEVENSDITWDKKKFFQPRFEDMNLQEINYLPIDIANFVAGCYQEIGSRFIDYSIEADAINFTVERTYKTNIMCLDELESLSDISFNSRSHYSFVRLDRLASPGYKKLEYTRAEEGMFGYFTTHDHELDVDNSDLESKEKMYVNRWNPNRGVVSYYLNDTFNKPEYAKLKAMTYRAFDVVNKSLEKSGTSLRVKLNEPNPAIKAGDIRNNMLIAVDDPQATGIIGYGPSAANPMTGEIVNARTVMYLGTIKKYVKWSYDEILEEKLAQAALASAGSTGSDPIINEMRLGVARQANLRTLARAQQEGRHLAEVQNVIDTASTLSASNNVGRNVSRIEQKAKELVREPRMSVRNLLEDPKSYMKSLSRIGCVTAELDTVAAAVDANLDDILKLTNSKPWSQLSARTRQTVIDMLLPYVWLPTLIHEVGHNMGLRHNFSGSEDSANWYTKAELEAEGAAPGSDNPNAADENPFKFSSVMDYAPRNSSELRIMGKYDIAAFRYAYNNQIELADGRMISIDDFRKSPSAQAKPYSFCTDENLGANPNCNQHDEGTNLAEIAQFFAKSYQDRYKRSNFRNDRRNFSVFGDVAQLGYLENMMFNFRASFERYEFIKNAYQLAEDDAIWNDIEFLKDLKQATLDGARVMMDILKTPDTMCVVATAADPNQIAGIVPLAVLAVDAITCFDKDNVQLNPAYVVVGEGGKAFQSKKDPKSTNAYIDQVDVRGIWLDKMVASRMLFQRVFDSPTFDRYTDNYLNIAALRPEIETLVQNIVQDEITGDIDFTMADGQVLKAAGLQYSMADNQKIDMHLHSGLRRYLGLPDDNSFFHHELIKLIGRELPSSAHRTLNRQVIDKLAVHPASKAQELGNRVVKTVDFGSERILALRENTIGLELIARIETVRELAGIDPAVLEAAVTKFEATPNAAPANAAETAVKKVGVARAKAVLEGTYNTEEFYANTLREMATLSN